MFCGQNEPNDTSRALILQSPDHHRKGNVFEVASGNLSLQGGVNQWDLLVTLFLHCNLKLSWRSKCRASTFSLNSLPPRVNLC